jgi:hypothetical protein
VAEATCKTCPFYSGDRESECRRNPPTIATNARPGDPGQPVDPHWHMHPNTRPESSCGEHPLRQRDRLAAIAMQGLCACSDLPVGTPDTQANVARLAYQVADAMLAERKRRLALTPPAGA